MRYLAWSSVLALAPLAAGCGGVTPRFEHGAPVIAAESTCPPVPAESVRLSSDGSTISYASSPAGDDPVRFGEVQTSTTTSLSLSDSSTTTESSVELRSGAYPDMAFSPETIAEAAPVPARARRLGDLRTRDHFVTAEVYEALACALTSGPSQSPSSEERCLARAAPWLEAIQTELRRRAGSAGADLAHQVRCFGRNADDRLRTWCEAVAYSTHAAPTSPCPETAQRDDAADL